MTYAQLATYSDQTNPVSCKRTSNTCTQLLLWSSTDQSFLDITDSLTDKVLCDLDLSFQQ